VLSGIHTAELVFDQFQAENWSPNGEARDLIASKGLLHTSMSTGDIVTRPPTPRGWTTFIVAPFGFVPIHKVQ
jgi:hypothetical protein